MCAVCVHMSVREKWGGGWEQISGSKRSGGAASIVALTPNLLRAGWGCPPRGAQRCFLPSSALLEIKDIFIFL